MYAVHALQCNPLFGYACQLPASPRHDNSPARRAQVVLGTESGMITAIVRKVQAMLRAAGRADVDVEVVFPVASEAVTVGGRGGGAGAGEAPRLPGGLALMPGPAGGEGCSMEGGCASCPFMKVDAVLANTIKGFEDFMLGLDVSQQEQHFNALQQPVLWQLSRRDGLISMRHVGHRCRLFFFWFIGLIVCARGRCR